MKNILRQIGFIAITAIIGLAFIACDKGNGMTDPRSNVGGVL